MIKSINKLVCVCGGTNAHVDLWNNCQTYVKKGNLYSGNDQCNNSLSTVNMNLCFRVQSRSDSNEIVWSSYPYVGSMNKATPNPLHIYKSVWTNVCVISWLCRST
jgi:hypothetical protein